MATITLGGNPVKTTGQLPELGTKANNFKLVGTDLSEITLNQFLGKKVLLNIFPSIATGICSASSRKFNELLNKRDEVVVLCVSKDLPFAHKHFCETEGLEKIIPASSFRDSSFEDALHITMTEGKMEGLFSRAVVVINEKGEIIYTEQVPEIGQTPDYDKAMLALDNK